MKVSDFVEQEIVDGILKVNINIYKLYNIDKNTKKQINREILDILDTTIMIIVNRGYKTYDEGLKMNFYLELYNRISKYINDDISSLYLLYSKKLNMLKIGITKQDINKRLSSIKKDINDSDIEVLCIKEYLGYLERDLHKMFKEDNVIYW